VRREPLEVERLIRADQRHTAQERRRVSVAEHERFRADIAARLRAMQQPDPIDDELEPDPAVELHARRRKNSEAARVLAILDSLKEGATEA
jgi:hypothetical protein